MNVFYLRRKLASPITGLLLLLMPLANCFGQTKFSVLELNLGFEKVIYGKSLPDQWTQSVNNHIVTIDSLTKHRGNKSILIKSSLDNPNGSFGSMVQKIPANFECKEIELRAYIKTANVTKGSAKLVLCIDRSSGNSLQAKMKGTPVGGTTEWTLYSVKLPYPENAETISMGAVLNGKGQIWIDDFEIVIDGRNILFAKFKENKVESDKEFDLGSGIGVFELSEQKIMNLKLLGLVWGYLKYYHPNVAAANFNWDYQLFRILPLIIKAENPVAANNLLCQWIDGLGPFPVLKNKEVITEEVRISPDLDWMNTPGLSAGLQARLGKIKNASRNGLNYYIGLYADAGNPEFKNEKPYTEMKYPDTGFRLLSLYRYWNQIQYFFPYKNLIEEDWKEVLKEFIPKFIGATNEIQYKLVVMELIARINDSHATLSSRDTMLSNYHGKYISLANITFVENKAVVTDFESLISGGKSDLIVGDVISHVNNVSVDDIVINKMKYTSASNYPTKLRNIARRLLWTNDSVINLTVNRNGETLFMNVKSYSSDLFVVRKYPDKDTCFTMLRNDIGYLFPGLIKNKYLPEIMSEIKNAKGLIIDMRCYPSEFIVFSLGKYLLPDTTGFVKYSNGSITNPGLFTIKDVIKGGEKNPDYYKGKVVILMNENTQSQAEYTVMALSTAPRATVVGSTTSGADGDTSVFDIVGGMRTRISGIGWYYADGRETQRIGIVPDVVVKPTIEGVRLLKDELLLKAIEIIDEN